MKKMKMWILMITCALTLAGCGKAEPEVQKQVDLEETTEILETSVPAPTGYASEEVQRISIFYDGSLYLYHATGFDLPKEEDWEFLGKVVSVNNLEWPVEDFCGTHLNVGQEIYRKSSEPHKLYVKYDKGFALFSSSVQGEIKQASPTSLELKLTNSGNETIGYGDAYTLEVFQQDTWEPLPVLLEDYGFHDVLYELKPEESQLLDIGFEWLYGTLSPGRYRIVKEMFRSTGKAFFVSADFDIASPGAYPPCVMVDGIIYKDTGYISSMAGCGTMDGEIVSTVSGTKLPSENDQSNFGSGYFYQRSFEGHIIVMIDDRPVIFRDMKNGETEIPVEVIHFTGEVKEITDSGELLVTHISTAEGFQMDGGDYYVSTENMREEVFAGDVVEVWFDGRIMETYPLQLGRVYRVEKVE